MKNQKGITLIALVITIIVLLILAGVSIAMLTGDNGLLTKAKTTQTATDKAEAADKVNMELQAIYTDLLAGDSLTECTDKDYNGVSVTITADKDAENKATGTYSVNATMTKGDQTADGSIAYDTATSKYILTPAIY